MKKSLISLACAAALLPGVAVAADLESDEYFITDSMSFTAGATFADVTISWTDLITSLNWTNGTGTGTEWWEGNGLYTVVLTKANGSLSKGLAPSSYNDVSQVTSGAFNVLFDGLTVGNTYKVVVQGSWWGSPGGNKYEFQDPSVVIGNIASAPVVPEPETYAMLLAGLGMVGVIARRRRQS